MNGTLLYLASPYSHPDPREQEERFRQAALAAGRFMAAGIWVFSPIAHTHPIAVTTKLPGDWAYWKEYDTVMIERCDAFCVLTLDGWRESKGVWSEMSIAKELGRTIMFIGPGEEPFSDVVIKSMGGKIWNPKPKPRLRQRLQLTETPVRPQRRSLI